MTRTASAPVKKSLKRTEAEARKVGLWRRRTQASVMMPRIPSEPMNMRIITEAWVRLRHKPTFRASASVRFKDFFTGADAVRVITQAGLYPANCRLLEAREALPGIPWDSEEAVLVLAFESADHPLDAWMKRALEICRFEREHQDG